MPALPALIHKTGRLDNVRLSVHFPWTDIRVSHGRKPIDY